MEAQSGLGTVTSDREDLRVSLWGAVRAPFVRAATLLYSGRQQPVLPGRHTARLLISTLSLGGLAGRCRQCAAVVGPEPHRGHAPEHGGRAAAPGPGGRA